MVQLPKRQHLTWDQIAGKVEEFADRYHLAERSYPLDIEEIAEFDLGIELRIVAGVHDECGTPAQIGLCSDRPIISVDAGQYSYQTSFYRYSLAHEIAHWVLHREWLLAYWKTNASIATWKRDLALISEEDYKWLESQADEFASYLLAPECIFEPFLVREIARLEGIGDDLNPDAILSYIARPVGDHFGMSSSAAQARIRKCPTWKRFVDEL